MVTGLGHAVAVAGGCKCLMDQLRPVAGGWWLMNGRDIPSKCVPLSILAAAAAAAQLGAVTRDIDDAAAEESDEQGEDNADRRVVSMGLFIEI